jgi:hypothetical protein
MTVHASVTYTCMPACRFVPKIPVWQTTPLFLWNTT